jgi:cell division transport system permease protein
MATLSGSYIVLVLFAVATANVKNIMREIGEDIEITVYLSSQTNPSQIQSLRNQFRQMKQIKDILFVPAEDAAKQMAHQMKNLAPGLLQDEDYSTAFPSSFHLRLFEEASNSSQWQGLLQSIADQISAMNGVEDVVYGHDWLKNYKTLVAVISSILWLIGSVLIFGSFFVIGSAIKSFVFQKRHEVEVLEMVGATSKSIRLPFLIEGASIGFLCSLIALLVSFSIFAWGRNLFLADLRFASFGESLFFFDFWQLIGAISLGTLLGLLSAFINIRSLNSGWASIRSPR